MVHHTRTETYKHTGEKHLKYLIVSVQVYNKLLLCYYNEYVIFTILSIIMMIGIRIMQVGTTTAWFESSEVRV